MKDIFQPPPSDIEKLTQKEERPLENNDSTSQAEQKETNEEKSREMREKLLDPNFLPTRKDLQTAFDFKEHPAAEWLTQEVIGPFIDQQKAEIDTAIQTSQQELSTVTDDEDRYDILSNLSEKIKTILDFKKLLLPPRRRRAGEQTILDQKVQSSSQDDLKENYSFRPKEKTGDDLLRETISKIDAPFLRKFLTEQDEPTIDPNKIQAFIKETTSQKLIQTLREQEWKNFFDDERHSTFELWNEEYLNGLAEYLAQSITRLDLTTEGDSEEPIVILEAGAGDGRLTHFLQQKLDRLIPGKVKIIACDSGTQIEGGGSWNTNATFPVEKMDQKEAIEKHKPKIVICSWMMPNQDLSRDFRVPSVEEYLLIGKADSGISGEEWKTWGNDTGLEDEGVKDLPPYEKDGFGRQRLEEVSDKQISKLDDVNVLKDTNYANSSTTSFKRKK